MKEFKQLTEKIKKHWLILDQEKNIREENKDFFNKIKDILFANLVR